MRTESTRAHPAAPSPQSVPAADGPAATVALLYLRVSAPVQLHRCGTCAPTPAVYAHATARSWTIVGMYEDVMSGSRGDRPDYRRLLAAVPRPRLPARDHQA